MENHPTCRPKVQAGESFIPGDFQLCNCIFNENEPTRKKQIIRQKEREKKLLAHCVIVHMFIAHALIHNNLWTGDIMDFFEVFVVFPLVPPHLSQWRYANN